MNSVDLVTEILSTMKFPYPVVVDKFRYIQVHGIRHRDVIFYTLTNQESIAIVESDHVFVFAYEYDVLYIPGGITATDGVEVKLYLADPQFFTKLEEAVNNHISKLLERKT